MGRTRSLSDITHVVERSGAIEPVDDDSSVPHDSVLRILALCPFMQAYVQEHPEVRREFAVG